MKILRTLLIVGLFVFATQIAFSQKDFKGKVVEVVDGKTVVIEIPVTKNRFTAQLEYIEIPEPDQQLSQTVKEHLKILLIGKEVNFVARIIEEKKLIGKVFLGEIDISQQLLRDGAAWYALLEKSSHEKAESENYQIIEAQAKLEKRGVWGVENLKPSWEFRAEKAKIEKEKAEELARKEIESSSLKPQMANGGGYSQRVTTPITRTSLPRGRSEKITMWADVSGNQEKKYLGIEGLFSNYHSENRIGYIYTGGSFLDLGKNDIIPQIEFRTFFVYQGSQTTVERNVFLLGFLAESKTYQFEKVNSITIVADKKQIFTGKPIRFSRLGGVGVQELLVYKVERNTLEKILKAAEVNVKIGKTSASMNELSQVLMEKLLNVSN